MTEDQAKQTWCSETRVAVGAYMGLVGHTQFVVTNRHAKLATPADFNCLASGCMQWRTDNKGGRMVRP